MFLFCCVAAKKPSDAAPKPKKTPAPKAKKPDKSIWDSDSDTGSKKTTPALKGTVYIFSYALDHITFWAFSQFFFLVAGKGRGRKRKGSGSEDEYNPKKKAPKSAGSKVSVSVFISATCKECPHKATLLPHLPPQKPQKPPSDDDDDDSNDLNTMSALSRDRPGRAKRDVKYFDESDREEDDDEDDDMF